MPTPEVITAEFLPGDAPTPALDPGAGLAAMLGLLGGGAGDPLGQLQSQMGALAASNPQLGSLLQMLQQRRAQPAQSSASLEEEPEAPLPPPPGPALADVQALMDHASSLEAEVDALRGRNDALAAALGACHLCFGEDRGCEVCHGTGLPGWRPPERNAFRRFVLPALRRVRSAPRAPAAPANSFPASRCAGPQSFNGTEGPLKRRGLEQGTPRTP